MEDKEGIDRRVLDREENKNFKGTRGGLKRDVEYVAKAFSNTKRGD